jgi:hypothetical protein
MIEVFLLDTRQGPTPIKVQLPDDVPPTLLILPSALLDDHVDVYERVDSTRTPVLFEYRHTRPRTAG